MNINNFEDLKKISTDSTPQDLVNLFSFEDGLLLSRKMLLNDEWDQKLQEYSTSLLEELRRKYPDEWNSKWEYGAFLGYAYHIINEYDKRYFYLKKAFDAAISPPPELLIALARCCSSPGIPPISEEEAISLVKKSMEKEINYEGAMMLRGLYKSKGNRSEQEHWDSILESLHNKARLPSLADLIL